MTRRLAAIATILLALPAAAGNLLKQSTQITVMVGPFVDKTDGVTAEAGLAGNGSGLAQRLCGPPASGGFRAFERLDECLDPRLDRRRAVGVGDRCFERSEDSGVGRRGRCAIICAVSTWASCPECCRCCCS